jgi:dihydroneopterin aldolase
MEEEAKIGSDYIINAEVKTNLDKSAKTDNLNDTVDYVAIYTIVFEEMKIRSKLLETVVQRIIDRVFEEHKTVQEVTI